MLGGNAGFAAGRAAADRAYAARPGGLGGVRADARAHRAVLGRIVRYLARGHADRLFPDIAPASARETTCTRSRSGRRRSPRLVHVDRDR